MHDANGYPYRTTMAGSYVETNYDKFGVLRSKSWYDPNELANTVNYTYDNNFRLIREAGTGYLNTYSYDSYGRMTQKLRRVTDNNHTVDVNLSIQYDSDNHISSTASTFNNSQTTVTEQFYYSSSGYKTRNDIDSVAVWRLIKQDRWGNATEESDFLGTTTHSYDDYGNMLSMNRTGNTSLSESYTYNVQTGNMSSKNSIPLTYDSMNQLTGWGSQTYSYDDLGNITSQPHVGEFTYDGFRVDEMSADSNYVIDDSLRISYYKAIERPRSIENEHYKADFYYDGNGDRYMMKVYTKVNGHCYHSFTRYYLDANAEVTLDSLSHYFHTYYAGGDAYTAPAVKEITSSSSSCIYQITRDNLGSVLLYENANGVRYQYSYSPWGVRTHFVGDSLRFYLPGEVSLPLLFYRTYTGHEDLWMFGLLNANARLYSPYLGRFVSPDPLLNSEGGPLDYNPYIYARNNPYKYIDRNGELAWFVPFIIGFVAGGAMNVACNWDDIHNVGDFCSYFGVGGVAGAIGAAAAVVAPAGVLPGGLYGALGGSLSGGILGGCNNLLKGLDFWSGASSGALYGAASGALFGGLTGAAKANAAGLKGASYWTGRERVNTIVNPPAANTSATPKEMLSTPSKGSQPNYPETVNTSDYPNPYYVDGSKEIVTLDKGTVIDRFSPSINELKGGTFFGEPGTSYIERGLLHNPAKGVTYGRWELTQPLQVEKSLVAPIPKFNIPGGGVQYRFLDSTPGSYMNANQMMNKGFIKVMSVPFLMF